ncbi:hypothetical protein AVEN_142385-1 [Araneus ventricosus]|uniref:Uncharacterized protein n=1 Tax=Araneus ventricosus TaxID=182803 RepID=A0A4Y2WPH4_ARAVE|nr:hypothetical protein AVEN_142385-1 [Araneus ventricosus]
MTMWRRQDLRYLPVFHIIIQSLTFYSSVLDGLATELQFWYWRILDLRHASKKVLSCCGVVVLVDHSQTSSRWYGVEVFNYNHVEKTRPQVPSCISYYYSISYILQFGPRWLGDRASVLVLENPRLETCF